MYSLNFIFGVFAWKRWTLIELRMCSHYLPWNWDLPKTTIDDEFFFCGRKIWHRIDHNGSIKSYLKHYQPALSLSLTHSLMFCAARIFYSCLLMPLSRYELPNLFHTGPFSILCNHLSFIDSLFYQPGWYCIISLNMWRSIIGYKSLLNNRHIYSHVCNSNA